MAREIKRWSDFKKADLIAIKAGKKAAAKTIERLSKMRPDELNISKSTIIILPNNTKILVTITDTELSTTITVRHQKKPCS